MFFENGMKFAEIARATGNDIKTVKKYIHIDYLNSPKPVPKDSFGSKLDPFKEEFDMWLEAGIRYRGHFLNHYGFGPAFLQPLQWA